ncbi:GspE/PulE family protein [Pleionea mediterranea]|jgi:MSHA biogenesis protein MshE|uniref:MSHA biogenesis protein MshE n=1 Tax=Pleionea mediterranea TaxID=523701 RepID=A0A316FVX6_9GAMM|nr:GspE/PulE family protein [Pleionea mediterranea]PWK52934.1 MSHA biogenesis protein MshE [Pleionea mediterranea]
MLRKKIRLGDLLVEGNVITEDQLMDALKQQKSTGQRLGSMLVNLGYVGEEQLLRFLAQQLEIDYIDLPNFKVNQSVIGNLSEIQARRFRTLVIDEKPEGFLIAMADPTDLHRYDQIQAILKKPVKVGVAKEADIIRNIDLFYRKTSEISSLAEELEGELGTDEFELPTLADTTDSDEAPVAKLLKSVFEEAVQLQASDVHIEPDQDVIRIRLRVDGSLQEQVMKEKRIASALVLRLKLMCGLDISEKRKPQDGRFNIKVRGHSVDVRLSTMPVQNGESVVMRLLDQTSGILRLDEIGMDGEILNQFRQLLRSQHGMVLVTGPTGSGKTTTLYSALSELNSPEKKIITIEDPVEYYLSRVNQVQVNTKIGLDFSRVLRAVLRQDPDIVLVGEMRDQETAEIGLRAAMTGHLVLSTLHTNDSISSALRLADMGAEPYLVASALRGIIAQRLVRRVCTYCAKDHQPDPQEHTWLESIKGAQLSNATFKHGDGCTQCNNTGYRGRVAIHEMLVLDDDMLSALRRNDVDEFTKASKASPLYKSLLDSVVKLAVKGVTSLEEVYRIGETVEETDLLPGNPDDETA